MHVARGAVGMGGLLVAALLWPSIGPLAVVPAAMGMLALRGCPLCWTVGLVQTLGRGRMRRECGEAGCTIARDPTASRGESFERAR